MTALYAALRIGERLGKSLAELSEIDGCELAIWADYYGVRPGASLSGVIE